jgi:hypothetical protein
VEEATNEQHDRQAPRSASAVSIAELTDRFQLTMTDGEDARMGQGDTGNWEDGIGGAARRGARDGRDRGPQGSRAVHQRRGRGAGTGGL